MLTFIWNVVQIIYAVIKVYFGLNQLFLEIRRISLSQSL